MLRCSRLSSANLNAPLPRDLPPICFACSSNFGTSFIAGSSLQYSLNTPLIFMVLYSVSTERRHGVSFSDEIAWAAGYEGYICRRCASFRLLLVKILLFPENLSLNSCYTKVNKEWTWFFSIACVVQYVVWQGFGWQRISHTRFFFFGYSITKTFFTCSSEDI